MMGRDLRREREIAKAAGPLRMWTPKPELRPRRSKSVAAQWLRQQALDQQEREAAAERVVEVILDEFAKSVDRP
jgi:ribosomal protein S7